MDSRVSSDRDRRRETEGVVIRESAPRGERREPEAYKALERDLELRLNRLRAEAREACEAWLADVDSDVSALTEFLTGSSEIRRPGDVKARAMEAWMKTLNETKVKPRKGRTRDLRRVRRAIRSMMETAFE